LDELVDLDEHIYCHFYVGASEGTVVSLCRIDAAVMELTKFAGDYRLVRMLARAGKGISWQRRCGTRTGKVQQRASVRPVFILDDEIRTRESCAYASLPIP